VLGRSSGVSPARIKTSPSLAPSSSSMVGSATETAWPVAELFALFDET